MKVQFNVHRGELQQGKELVAVFRFSHNVALLAQFKGKVHTGWTFERYSVTAANTVVAHFDNDRTARGILIVGADGLRSRVRRNRLSDDEAIRYRHV